ncbi:Fanconi anemia group D2 protein [Coemansia sp. RSA 1813]|nr:Fanconi anemia group D2 protein [Coemansia sp. RSA 1843]KAJ2213907.1 Fanconi anemia group D2 protein [Coemansia sp. RSA 487]KAJ2569593.1 Fanconi anemia group D2 protein [Coemansia sp. RSA 1813]
MEDSTREQFSQETFASCGVELSEGCVPVLHTSAALFRFKLSENISANKLLAQECGDYIGSLLSDHDTISLYLDPVSLGNTDDSSIPAPQSVDQPGLLRAESFVRLVLGVDVLQSRVISTLLEKFPEFIGEEDSQEDEDATKVSVKILRQLRWLDYVIDSAGLVDKLLETLGYVPPEMQREIISALPDIISDADSVQVSRVLAEMMTSTPELMLPILETLGSLECSPHLLQEARNSVVMHLVSAEPLDLPVMIRFLLHSVSSDAAGPLIVRIRKRLDLDSIVLASRQLHGASDDQTPDVLIFDIIATSLRSHKHLRDAWLKTIASDTSEVGPHTTLDFAVLLILHQITTHTKRVESILKAKIETVASHSVAYTPRTIESIIERFPAVFSAHFTALLSVASWLVRTSPTGGLGSQVATSMLVAAFGTMGMFQRQEISGELTVHIGSGNINEMDTAARTCLQLAHSYPYELRPFAIFIKGLLDYVDNLPIEHVRIIFDVLGIVSTLGSADGGGDGGTESSLFNDLYIFVRKQLASVYPKYNRVGIVGTVALLRQLGSKDNAAMAASSSGDAGSSSRAAETQQGANIHALRRAVQLLEMLMDSGRHQSWAFVSMTYDELAHVVETKGLHIQLLTWLHENVSSTFASQFLGDPELLCDRYMLPGQPYSSLSIDDEEPTILDIFNHNLDASRLGLCQLVKRPDASDRAEMEGIDSPGASGNKDSSPRLRGCLLSCLPSLLRLIQVCEKALSEQSLAEIDSLLVCGVYLLPSIDIDATVASKNTGFQGARYVLAKPGGNAHSDTSFQLSGNALVGINEEARVELTESIRLWPPELRRIVCTSLYAAANWVREIINAFADQPSAEMRSKVVVRVNQLWQIESDLEAIAASLDDTPYEFHPVAAGLLPEVSDSPATWTAPTVPTLRIQGTGDAGGVVTQGVNADADSVSVDLQNGQVLEHNVGAYTVDVDGLLLSQDDTVRFVEYGAEVGSAEAAPADGAKKRGRKRKSASTNASGTSTAGSLFTNGTSGPAEGFTKSPALYLRELSFSAFSVLNFNSKQLVLSQERQGASIPKLTAHGLYVILRELNAALSVKLVRQGERRFPFQKQNTASITYGQLATFSSNISSSSSNAIIDSLLPLLPSLLKYLENCLVTRAKFRNDVELDKEAKSESENRLLASVDTLADVDMVETCIDTLLQIISSILYWDGLQGEGCDPRVDSSTSRRPKGKGVSTVLGVFLSALAEQGKHMDANEMADLSKSVLIRRAFDYIHGLSSLVATSTRAMNILRMLIALRDLTRESEHVEETQYMAAEQRENTMNGRISNLARRILFADWSEVDFLKPRDLEYVVMQYFTRYPHNRLELVHRYATATLLRGLLIGDDLEDGDDEDKDITGTLRPSTFSTYYSAVHHALAIIIKEARFDDMNGQELLGCVGKVGESWLSLAKLTQKLTGDTQRKILLHALNGGHVLVDLFIKQLVPQLDKYFLMHRDDVLLVFNRVQKSTRILQNICNHSKVSKDMKLQSAVPRVKRSLEQLLFKVIAMMENNDCIGAINLGNLKHRDISGTIVSSQIPQSATEDEASEDDLGIGLNADDDIPLGCSDAEQDEPDDVNDGGTNRVPLQQPPVGAGKCTKLVAARKQLLANRQRGSSNRARHGCAG